MSAKDLEHLVLPSSLADAPVPEAIGAVVLRFLARVVTADGRIAGEELSLLVGLAMQLGVDGTLAKQILDDELARPSDPAQLAAQLPDEGRRREVYAMGCLMGATDGSLAEAERRVLAQYAAGAGIPAGDAENILETVIEASKKHP
jgi:uncharacterized membrane protein YebE (DUF533 family)